MQRRPEGEINKCLRKRKYYSFDSALKACQKAKLSGLHLSVYECPWCRDFHLTTFKAQGKHRRRGPVMDQAA